MCGAIQGGLSLDGVNVAKEAIIQGQVLRVDASGHGVPVENAYVRLLDRTGEFTAEVPTNESGHFKVLRGQRRVDAYGRSRRGRTWWTSRSRPRWARWPRWPSLF